MFKNECIIGTINVRVDSHSNSDGWQLPLVSRRIYRYVHSHASIAAKTKRSKQKKEPQRLILPVKYSRCNGHAGRRVGGNSGFGLGRCP
jgi:hypothetical protein